jgi:hypothetical protein
MLAHKFLVLAALSLSTIGAIAGCSADVVSDDDMVEESDDELSKAGKALIGAYKDDSGSFRGLILTNKKVGLANEFIADVDTGINCVTTPCPSSERITGTFTASKKTISFRSSTASPHARHLLGRYNYKVQGAKLSLSRKGFAQSLEEVVSYCGQPSDCELQNLIVPQCIGTFVCAEESSCSYQCGKPVPPPPPPPPQVCLSSASCAPGEHCSVEDGVCNSTGMLAVCSGTCVK